MWPWSTQRKLDQILRNQAKLSSQVEDLIRVQFQTIELLEEIEITLQDVLLRCSNPGVLKLRITGEDPMSDKILFQVVLPSKSAPDVVRRELTVSFADGTSEQFELNADVTVSDTLKADQDTLVKAVLVDIDDAGNRSEPSEGEFLLEDTVAPPQPGELGILIQGEETQVDSEG